MTPLYALPRADDITMIDLIASAACVDSRVMHLTGCISEERIMIELSGRVLDLPEATIVHDLLSLLSRTDSVRDIVIAALSQSSALMGWVQS